MFCSGMVKPTDHEMIATEDNLLLTVPKRKKGTPCHAGPREIGGRQKAERARGTAGKPFSQLS